MSLSTAMTWEVRTTGSDNNGGGFKTGATGTDRSQQNAAQATLSASSTVHTTTSQINVAAGDFTVSAADVGNVLQVTGGTATAGFYEITAVDVPNNRWTMDRAVGTSTQTVVGAMGGALASPGKLGAAMAGGNDAYIQAGTYTTTSTTSNVSGGRLTPTNGASAQDPTRIIGYQSARGDLGTKPVFKAGVGHTSFTLITLGFQVILENVETDGSGNTSVTGIKLNSSPAAVLRCRARSCTIGIQAQGVDRIVALCEAISCTTGMYITNNAYAFGCQARTCPGNGFESQNGMLVSCIASGGTSGGHGFGSTATGIVGLLINCTSYGNAGKGFYSNNTPNSTLWINCLAVGNTGVGFDGGGANASLYLENCAAYNNGGGATANIGRSSGFVTLTADPFTNAAGGDFSLNSIAGGGAACRQAGIPGAFPAGTTTGYPDIGAAQAMAGAAGAGALLRHPGMSGGMAA